MINDKKSEEAALSYCAKCLEITNRNIDLDKDECVDLYNGFINGARWAINEFLKDLWHPTGEAPKRGRLAIVENDGQIGRHYTIQINDYYSWESFAKGANITRWLYISDLLPKEGGE